MSNETRAIFSILLLASISSSLPCQAQNFNYPQVVVKKSVTPPIINKKEWATVTITVTGDTRTQPQNVPVSLVLALDYSGSMSANSAYVAVGAAAKHIVSLLTPGSDHVALITIKDTATVEIPMTSNFSGITQTVDGLGPSGGTNIQDAFDKANGLLNSASTPNRMVILMSDGLVDSIQSNHISKNWQLPASLGIKYYTVGYGPNTNDLLLQFLADKTGGIYLKAPTQQDLKAAFQSAYKTGSTSLSTRDVSITEFVSNNLHIRPDSLDTSFTSYLNDPIKFQADLKAAEATFYTTRELILPKVHFLGGNQMFSFAFDVTSEDCSEKNPLQIGVDEISQAFVTYNNGQANPVTKPLPQANLTVNQCGVSLTKDWDEQKHTVALKLRNNHPRSIRNVRVIENPSSYFVISETVTPNPSDVSPSAASWFFGEIESDKELEFEIKLKGSPYAMSISQPGPYPLDGPDAVVDYYVDKLQFEIRADQVIFPNFESDLSNRSISNVTSTFFASQGHTIQLGPGSLIMLIASLVGTPPPEFGWVIASGQDRFPVKKTPEGYQIYKTVWEYKYFPQAWTSATYRFP